MTYDIYRGDMRRLTFWQNAVSIHQAPFIQALATIWRGEINVVTDEGLSERRRAQGWAMPDYGKARLYIGPHTFAPAEIEERFGGPGSVQLFSSVTAYPGVRAALKTAGRRRDALVGVFAEAGSTIGGLKAWLRPWRHRLDALRWRDRIDFFLAVGSTGYAYYARCGYRSERLYPFGYAVVGSEPAAPKTTSEKHVVFVGQLVNRKGADLLFDAFASSLARRESWTLDIVGDGPLRARLGLVAEQLGIADKVRWHGNQPNKRVRELIRDAVMLVLPSRFDGWGASVNEALMAGRPVIVSDGCGAADLVRDSDRGIVFPAGSAVGLAKGLMTMAGLFSNGQIAENAIRDWAQRAISPYAFADYFTEIVAHASDSGPRPAAPWVNQ